MNIIEQIFESRKVESLSGEWVDLDSNIDRREGAAIERILLDNPDFKRTIEIGFAQGISSLFICNALNGRNDPCHTVIDPNQTSHWKGIGINNMKKLGFDNFRLFEEGSETALAKLLDSGETFDFGLIDGWHTFDHTLLDFFYLEKLVRVGGIICVDDVTKPGVNKAMRHFMTYPNLRLIDRVRVNTSLKAKFRDGFINGAIGSLKYFIPKKYHWRVFSFKLLFPDKAIGLDSSMVFFEKTDEDRRPWNWFEHF
ncbi:class I SAM-dependent methyltransferase [Negadavirga shengliensis]|uniref:Class I SAM-dependent methyltransferase n=1 Tax=Negadavirga shengliensis TaxID=1389218 RepID=A0ABV9T556_9BACT